MTLKFSIHSCGKSSRIIGFMVAMAFEATPPTYKLVSTNRNVIGIWGITWVVQAWRLERPSWGGLSKLVEDAEAVQVA